MRPPAGTMAARSLERGGRRTSAANRIPRNRTPVSIAAPASLVSAPLRPLIAGDETTFPEPEAAIPWAVETLREGSSERRFDHDEKTGTVTLTLLNDSGEVRDLDHGLVSASIGRELRTIHPDDPLSARGETHWSDFMSRNALSLRTEIRSSTYSDAKNFYPEARIEAYEGNNLVFERGFKEKISRNRV